MDLAALKRLIPLVKHLTIAIGIGVLIIIIFFYWFLPFRTNHGETITVPDVTNQHLTNLDDVLVTRSLRYEVNADSSYNPDQAPLTVIDQFPKAGSKVKENRKIYVTLNAENPPLVKMPNLVDKSLKIAQITLNSYGLKAGKISYKADLALNVVLEQHYRSEPVEEGKLIPKGSTVDLFIGDGNGNRFLSVQNHVNQTLEDTRVALAGMGLKVGTITNVNSPIVMIQDDTSTYEITVPIGNIVRQRPAPGVTVRLEDVVDLWIYQPMDSTSHENNILEQEE